MNITQEAKKALSIDAFIDVLDAQEEWYRNHWYEVVAERIKKARHSMAMIKQSYRLCTMFEDSLLDYLEKYNDKHRWMSPRGMELLQIWSTSSFWRNPEYFERVPESLIAGRR